MSPLHKAVALLAFMAVMPFASSEASEQDWVRISDDGKGFVLAESGKAKCTTDGEMTARAASLRSSREHFPALR